MSWGMEDSGYGKRSDISELQEDNRWLKNTIITDKEELKILRIICKKYMQNNYTNDIEKRLIDRILNKK